MPVETSVLATIVPQNKKKTIVSPRKAIMRNTIPSDKSQLPRSERRRSKIIVTKQDLLEDFL